MEAEYTGDLDSIADLPFWLRGLDDRVSAMSGYMLKEGEYRWFCNERWATTFINQKESVKLLYDEGIFPWYFMSR